jgi:hypothetical protein
MWGKSRGKYRDLDLGLDIEEEENAANFDVALQN